MIKEKVDLAYTKRNSYYGNSARRRVLDHVVQIGILISAAAFWYYTKDIIIPLFIMLVGYLSGTVMQSKKRILELEMQLADERYRSSISRDA